MENYKEKGWYPSVRCVMLGRDKNMWSFNWWDELKQLNHIIIRTLHRLQLNNWINRMCTTHWSFVISPLIWLKYTRTIINWQLVSNENISQQTRRLGVKAKTRFKDYPSKRKSLWLLARDIKGFRGGHIIKRFLFADSVSYPTKITLDLSY